MRRYKHIFFDLDHTLWDFDKNAESTLTEIYAYFSLDTLVEAGFEAFYRKYLYHNEKLWARYQNGYITADELKWRRMWRTLLDFKIADETLARNISSIFLDILPTKQQVFPHTHEILKYLLDKGYTLHLITNGFEKTQRSKLKHSGLDAYFTEIVTSEVSNSMKPLKEIFDYAVLKAGTNMSDCIMIGDNLEADIQGAMNAGMDSIFVNHTGAVCHIQPTHIVTHLKDLEKIF